MRIVPYLPSHENAVNDLLARTGWPDHYDSFIDTDCLVVIDGDGTAGG